MTNHELKQYRQEVGTRMELVTLVQEYIKPDPSMDSFM
jgi:hypothetical protein